MKRLIFIFYIIIGLTMTFNVSEAAENKKPFVVVIDAGHGGKDDGASGKKKLKEKDINLAVALKLGKLINQIKGVRVYYTRKTDVFVPLAERSNYANKLDADLFISIHTNSAETRTAKGTEVYSFSTSSNSVAMRENSVMELEDNYKKKYDGFDPNSSESYIQWDLIASDFGYSGQSKSFASYISKQFEKNIPLENRGIRQAGFWVLKYSKMPGVLVEVGYVSNPDEEKWLRKDTSRELLAKSIYNAFVKYKADYDKKNTSNTNVSESSKKIAVSSSKGESSTPSVHTLTSGVHYKAQIYTGPRKSMYAKEFKHCVPAQEYPTGQGYSVYVYGDETNLTDAKKMLKKVQKDFKDAFLVVYKNGKRLSKNEAQQYLH